MPVKHEGPGRFTLPEWMEAACQAPGRWRVEGYDVERHRQDGKDWWHVFTRYTGEPEVFHGKMAGMTKGGGRWLSLVSSW